MTVKTRCKVCGNKIRLIDFRDGFSGWAHITEDEKYVFGGDGMHVPQPILEKDDFNDLIDRYYGKEKVG